ncbi:MAG: hypothetical protein Q9Q40_00835 [Acidobacteriota bacterium]|nr:hypothetical protein [Acidobacteriota bacterium]MDQ7087033.1 hypothetical protein [Acidobacteriota bacterium]
MTRPLAERVRTALRFVREGRFQALRATVERGFFPAPLFRRNRLIIASLGACSAPAGGEGGDFDLVWAGRREMAALCAVRPRPRDFERFFDAGCLALLGLRDGVPCSLSWIELDPVHDSRPNAYRFPLHASAAWGFGYCSTEGLADQQTFHQHWHRKLAVLEQVGIDEVYVAVQSDDVLERAVHRRAGFTMVFELDVLRFCGATVHRVGRLADDHAGPRRRLGLGRWSPATGSVAPFRPRQ